LSTPDFTRAVTSVKVSNVIVRGCVQCGHPRQIGAPCAGCGLEDPPVVIDLGVQSYTHKNPLKRAAWNLVGSRLADRRVRRANNRIEPATTPGS
jgi:hypothetical protein